MRVLLLGSGGREHAIAWKLRQSPRLSALFAAPGNPGIASLARILPVNLSPPFSDLIAACRREKIDFVAVGPEEPLAQGVADRLNEAGIKVFGPSAEGARLEASKSFAKEIMRSAGIPTARAEIFTSAAAAEAHLAAHPGPCVIKADGLAAGKGVTVALAREEAVLAVREALVDHRFGAAGASVLIEEFLEGTEASLLAFADGAAVRAMESAQDYKRALDGDLGPNTGGMGAISPAPALTPEMRERAIREILEPAVAELRRRGIDYRGVLYAGLMICKDGPKTIEFNCRFGDPETQAILPRLESDLLEIMLACVERRLASADLRWRPETSVCVVAASECYPGDYPKGRVITGADPEPYSEISAASAKPERISIAAPLVFHAGTARDSDGRLVTSGGRVFGVTALGSDAESARAASYARLSAISFGGMRFRRDIAAAKKK